jgi:hypothetical protein
MKRMSSWYMLMILLQWMKTDTIKNNTVALLEASKEVGPDIKVQKTQYMVMHRHRNAGRYHNVLTANKSFENVANFREECKKS